MKKLILILFLLGIGSLVLAQDNSDLPNDPSENAAANACFEGGQMAGKCNQDLNQNGVVEDFEVTWAWQCGWYLIRYNFSLYSREEIPTWCDSLLPAEIPAAQRPQESSNLNTCLNIKFGYSIRYIGPANVLGNTIWYEGLNCKTLIGTDGIVIIFADSQSAAEAICDSFSYVMDADGRLSNYVVAATVPANAYLCTWS